MMKPEFYTTPDPDSRGDGWCVNLRRSSKTGGRVEDVPIFSAMDQIQAEDLAAKLNEGSRLIARALCGDEIHRTDDDITLIFSF
mgnify:CR=1 FL=1